MARQKLGNSDKDFDATSADVARLGRGDPDPASGLTSAANGADRDRVQAETTPAGGSEGTTE